MHKNALCLNGFGVFMITSINLHLEPHVCSGDVVTASHSQAGAKTDFMSAKKTSHLQGCHPTQWGCFRQNPRTTHNKTRHTHTHAHIHTLKRILYTSSCRLLNSRGIAYSAINIWNNMNLFAIIYIHLATCGDLTRLPWTPSLSPVHLPQPELLLASLATNHRYKVRTWTWRPW